MSSPQVTLSIISRYPKAALTAVLWQPHIITAFAEGSFSQEWPSSEGGLWVSQDGICMQVATLEDPASARFGESLYHFVPRSLAGNWKDATRLELARLQSLEQSPASIHNRYVSHRPALHAIPVVVI